LTPIGADLRIWRIKSEYASHGAIAGRRRRNQGKTNGRIGSGDSGKGFNAEKDDNMRTQDKPETLIQLLASYRRASFSQHPVRRRSLAALAGTIAHNCAMTVAFADRQLKKVTEDNEDAYTLCAVRDQAILLKRQCGRLSGRTRSKDFRKEVETLRLQYDNFTGSVRHLFQLLDCSLGEKLDGIL
jgi:hypothetical protein